jgi:hypothetical protein
VSVGGTASQNDRGNPSMSVTRLTGCADTDILCRMSGRQLGGFSLLEELVAKVPLFGLVGP